MHVIETTPEHIKMSLANGKTLNLLKKNGMSGTFFWTGSPKDSKLNGGHLVMQDNKELNINGHVTNYNGLKRGVLIFDGKNVIFKRIYNIKAEYQGNIKWAIGGLSLYPFYNPTAEGFTGQYADVLKKTNHSAIGVSNGGKIYLISVKNRTVNEFRNDMLNSKLGFKALINLDGGGTTQMYFDKSIISSTRGLNHFIEVI
ncbi:phosphodiester glycosidase family protein [Anaerosphaera multitolerans]|nr:phosphodiester glycosidase family protein [Anaerosphaera multitolerans]